MINADVTLRRLIWELNLWATDHKMVNDFGYGKYLEVFRSSGRDYAALIVNSPSATSDKWYINYSLEIICLDYVADEKANQDRVNSDTISIIRDLENTMRYSNRWQAFCRIDSPFNYRKVDEFGADKCFGWIATLTIKIKKRSGICNIQALMPEYDFETGLIVVPGCDPVTETLNGTAISSVPSGGSKAIIVQNDASTPAQVGAVLTDTATNLVVSVPEAGTTPLNTSNLYLDGQTTSYRTGDNVGFGRGTDWWNLGFNNVFGTNGKRFTGVTGGYQDEIDDLYYDKDSVATTYALAFPDDIMLDHSQWNQVGETIFGINMNVNGAVVWNSFIDAVAGLTYAGYSDWIPMNKNVLCIMTNDELIGGVPTLFAYPPMNYTISAQAQRLWAKTTGGITSRAYYLVENGGIQNTNKTSTASYIDCRIFTYADLVL